MNELLEGIDAQKLSALPLFGSQGNCQSYVTNHFNLLKSDFITCFNQGIADFRKGLDPSDVSNLNVFKNAEIIGVLNCGDFLVRFSCDYYE